MNLHVLGAGARCAENNLCLSIYTMTEETSPTNTAASKRPAMSLDDLKAVHDSAERDSAAAYRQRARELCAKSGIPIPSWAQKHRNGRRKPAAAAPIAAVDPTPELLDSLRSWRAAARSFRVRVGEVELLEYEALTGERRAIFPSLAEALRAIRSNSVPWCTVAPRSATADEVADTQAK